MTTMIEILLFDDAEELDFVGPWEVFTMAKACGADFDVSFVSQSGGSVTAAKGMTVETHHSLASAPAADVLLIPGGQGTRREVNNADLMAWIAETAAGCRWVTSVCTGSLLLHEAGPAKGKRVTTHWGFVETLRGRGNVTVLEAIRYVRDGNLVTSAGVSAGIDMALWLVGQLKDPAFARNVQRQMEYDPAPPYTAEV